MPHEGPVQVSGPSAAAAMVPHSSWAGSMAASDKRTPLRPSAVRGSAAGRLGARAARRACPVSASTENMTLASTGWLALEVSTTRKMASGRPLSSASPGDSGLTASTRASSGKSGSESTTRPNG